MADQLELVRTALDGRYRIVREIGRGGMATVYLAEDIRHRRNVAVKVLHPELAHVLGPARFVREIETAAHLTHPHILPLLDSGEVASLPFYVMPYVEAGSLRTKIERDRQLAVSDAVRLAAQVARALDYAHGEGVVHRDVKPENILLMADQAMITDFGIALALTRADAARLTESGMTVGTPAYMSPEQAAASDVSPRSDQYSLGCVLFEMLAGQPPFTGPTAESVIRQHLVTAPRPVTEIRHGVRPVLSTAIERCLSKAPADRFDSCRELAGTLEGMAVAHSASPTLHGPGVPATAGDGTARMTSLAPRPDRPLWYWRRRMLVLYGLVVLAVAWAGYRYWTTSHAQSAPTRRESILLADVESSDTTLAATVQDLLAAALDQSTQLVTVPRSQIEEALEASGRPRNAHVNLALAQELAYRRSVRAIVAGRLARVGEGHVITFRALGADSSNTIASVVETASNLDALIPAVQHVADKLRRQLGERMDAIRATRPLHLIRTPSFEALRAFRAGADLSSAGNGREAIEWYRRATEIDTGFAMAWGAMGMEFSNWDLSSDSAARFVRRALSLPDRLSDAQRLFLEGTLAYLEDDPVRQLRANQAHARLEPGPESFNNLALALGEVGRGEEALEAFRQAEALSVFGPSPALLANEWGGLLAVGRFQEAERVRRRLTGPLARSADVLTPLGRSDWATAESVGVAVMMNPAESEDDRASATYSAIAGQAARGAPSTARRTLHQRLSRHDLSDSELLDDLHMWALLDLLSGRPQTPPVSPSPTDTSSEASGYRALRASVVGPAPSARQVLDGSRDRAARRFAGRQSWLIAEGIAELVERNDDDVIRRLSPVARTGMLESRMVRNITPPAAQWLVARAWERSGVPDSAIAYYELATRRGGTWQTSWCAHAITLPYALHHLVVLNARIGRYDAAKGRLAQLDSLVTKPDDEFRGLLSQARAELAAAQQRESPIHP